MSEFRAIDWKKKRGYTPQMADKKIRSIAKTFSWRSFIFIYWIVFGYILTGTFKGASILGIGSIVPLFFYYFHERLWNRIKWGTDYKNKL